MSRFVYNTCMPEKRLLLLEKEELLALVKGSSFSAGHARAAGGTKAIGFVRIGYQLIDIEAEEKAHISAR